MIDGNFEDVVKERNDLLLRLAAAEERAEKAEASQTEFLKRCADLTIERDRLREQVEEWFPTFKGMCEKLYGVKDGLVNWPSYRCQAQSVYDEMFIAIGRQQHG